MKKYKTVIVSGKRIIKTIGIVMLTSFVTALSLYVTKDILLKSGAHKIVEHTIPVCGYKEVCNSEILKRAGRNIIKAFIGYDPTDEKSVISVAVPALKNTEPQIYENVEIAPFEDKYEVIRKKKDSKKIQIPPENQAPIKTVDARQKTGEGIAVAVGNETSYGVDINQMLMEKPEIDITGSGPKVLITHTHATESYAEEDAVVYDKTKGDRSDNAEENVVAVGSRLCDILNSKGIETVHDKILHDKPSFNGSYAHSLNTVNEYKVKYPGIQIVFDIHRDSIVYDDNTKVKVLTNIDNKPTAQLMLVVGTDEKGLYHPEWRKNLTAAIHFQKAAADRYPGLMRHINLRKERFNGHTTGASMIIEVGTSGNSLNEAVCAIEAFGECIADYLKNM